MAARGASPRRLRFHHVVLAYAVTEPSTLHVYDPNSGPSDDVTVTVGAGAITSTVNIGRDIRGLFPLRYRTVDPTP